VTAAKQPDRQIVLDRVRSVLGRLVRDGTAQARSDGSVHRLFPVAVGPAEGAAIRSWVIREAAACTVESGLGYGISALFVCEGLLSNGASGSQPTRPEAARIEPSGAASTPRIGRPVESRTGGNTRCGRSERRSRNVD